MDKFDFSRINFLELERFIDLYKLPFFFRDEFSTYKNYFCNKTWVQKQQFYRCSNGAYIGETFNGYCSGIGMYVFDNKDIYLGEYRDGEWNGEGFYYDYSEGLLFFGEWRNGNKNGKGHVGGFGYESEGIYQNGNEVQNMYIKNNGRSTPDKGNESNGCAFIVVCLIILYILAKLIF